MLDGADPATLAVRIACRPGRQRRREPRRPCWHLWREVNTAKATAENDVTVLEALAVDPTNVEAGTAEAAAIAARLRCAGHDAIEALAQRWRAAVEAVAAEAYPAGILPTRLAAANSAPHAAAQMLPWLYNAGFGHSAEMLENGRYASQVIGHARRLPRCSTRGLSSARCPRLRRKVATNVAARTRQASNWNGNFAGGQHHTLNGFALSHHRRK